MSQVKDIWDRGAEIYDEIYANNFPYHMSQGVIVDLLPKTRPVTILELGAGTGLLTHRILETMPGSRITCIEFSPKMVDKARERLAVFGTRATLLCADLVTWSPPDTYDAVVTCNTLVYKDIDLGESYAKYARTLKPGGMVLNSTVVKTDQLPLLAELMGNMNPPDVKPASREVLEFARTSGRAIAHFGEDSLAVARTVAEHLDLMAAADLTAACPWQYMTQAVIVGVRQSP
jgi:SAM-dependent methyltransferase